METTIQKDQALVTPVNVFTIEPENQPRLLDILIRATEVFKAIPGFPGVKEHRDKAHKIAKADFNLYKVVHVHHA